MSKQVALIFALLMTSAAADDYRSYREAYAGVDWPKSIASAEQCQQLILRRRKSSSALLTPR